MYACTPEYYWPNRRSPIRTSTNACDSQRRTTVPHTAWSCIQWPVARSARTTSMSCVPPVRIRLRGPPEPLPMLSGASRGSVAGPMPATVKHRSASAGPFPVPVVTEDNRSEGPAAGATQSESTEAEEISILKASVGTQTDLDNLGSFDAAEIKAAYENSHNFMAEMMLAINRYIAEAMKHNHNAYAGIKVDLTTILQRLQALNTISSVDENPLDIPGSDPPGGSGGTVMRQTEGLRLLSSLACSHTNIKYLSAGQNLAPGGPQADRSYVPGSRILGPHGGPPHPLRKSVTPRPNRHGPDRPMIYTQ